MNINPAREAINELAQVVEWLAATLLPGTGKPWTPPLMSEEKRAERDRENREREARDWAAQPLIGRVAMAPLGESPAPMDLGVMDLLIRILCTADELADEVSDAAEVARLMSASSAFADPTPFLRRAAAFISHCDAARQLAIESICDDLAYEALGALGMVGDGQVLAVVCPWCNGRTAHTPVGGARTMRVRVKLPAGKRSMVSVDPADLEWFVTCEGLCDPPSADCGERLRGRPAWPIAREGEMLAARFERATVEAAKIAAKVELIVEGLAS